MCGVPGYHAHGIRHTAEKRSGIGTPSVTFVRDFSAVPLTVGLGFAGVPLNFETKFAGVPGSKTCDLHRVSQAFQ